MPTVSCAQGLLLDLQERQVHSVLQGSSSDHTPQFSHLLTLKGVFVCVAACQYGIHVSEHLTGSLPTATAFCDMKVSSLDRNC